MLHLVSESLQSLGSEATERAQIRHRVRQCNSEIQRAVHKETVTQTQSQSYSHYSVSQWTHLPRLWHCIMHIYVMHIYCIIQARCFPLPHLGFEPVARSAVPHRHPTPQVARRT